MALEKAYSCKKHGRENVTVTHKANGKSYNRCRICTRNGAKAFRSKQAACHPERKQYGAAGLCKRCFIKSTPKRQATWLRTVQRRNLKTVYGLSLERYEEMRAAQGGLCAVCSGPPVGKNRGGSLRNLCVDHDHATGEVRALLCVICNIVVGHAENKPGLLEQVAAYLQRQKRTAAA